MIRRVYDPNVYQYLQPLQPVSTFITISAFLLGAAQLIFLANFFLSIFKGKKAEANPWEANTIEWSTPVPPGHGNWEGDIPEVHRGPYEYNVPGAPGDHVTQWAAPVKAESKG